MLRIFKSLVDGTMTTETEISDGCWISLINPTKEEIDLVSSKCHVDADDLRAPLDEEERSRLMPEDNYILILVDIPTVEDKDGKVGRYVTIPLGIILTDTAIITVCLEENEVLTCFTKGKVRGFYTFKKTRVILQILYRNATLFLQYLRAIDRKSEEIEAKLHISQKNQELIELLELEKSLVYFTTSLRSNEVVLEKMLRTEQVKKYADDEDLLEDVIIENKQAIEMANIYSGILSGMMDAFASVISNNLNIVMKLLATITIVLSIPTMIASFFGMNFVDVPLGNHPYGFAIITIGTCAVTGIVALICAKKKMF
ncbi:MAG: magnesium transporter CorA family protein [Lachnospiraceae bacterium]|nr:magnesium transporter CorA family protein [Lachnospiraceae bacterium]